MNTLLAKQQGKPINLNFIRMYWEQVCDLEHHFMGLHYVTRIAIHTFCTLVDARSRSCNSPTKNCTL